MLVGDCIDALQPEIRGFALGVFIVHFSDVQIHLLASTNDKKAQRLELSPLLVGGQLGYSVYFSLD